MLVRRREILARSAEPIGWKIGFNLPAILERLGLERPLAGFLTSDGLLEDGATWALADQGDVVVESEVAVEIADDARSTAALLPALELACRVTRKAGTVVAIGVYAERVQVHMGIVWIKALTLRTGRANVIGHVDRVLAMMAGGVLDPTPLVTHHMRLADASEAYAVYDRREALKIVMTP